MRQTLERSIGDIARRMDLLDKHTHIVIFESPREVGIYANKDGEVFTDLTNLRTEESGDLPLTHLMEMTKGTFYEQNLFVAICSPEMKKGRPVNYYGI